MKASIVFTAIVIAAGVGVVAQRGGGRGTTPEMQEALAKQEALEKSTPRLQVTEEVLGLTVPNHTIGEAVGVAKNSKGNLFVFTRSGNVGPAKGATASQLFEFDPMLKFVKQWGPDNYAASFAHTVRVKDLLLLRWRQLDHPPGAVRGQSGENPAIRPKIGVSHVGAFDGAGHAQGDLAELIGGH